MLLLDIGNTRLKWAWLQAGRPGPMQVLAYDEDSLDALLEEQFFGVPAYDLVLVCSVASRWVNQCLHDWFVRRGKQAPELMVAVERQCGVVNHYRNPAQLGVDRWMAMIGAHNRFVGDLCVISCGSAWTLDVVTAAGEHQGGLIMPGINIMRRSLLQNTAGIEAIEGADVRLADNTADAVYSGCSQLALAGMVQLVRRYREIYGNTMQCIITGGDGRQLADAIQPGSRFEDDLVLQGLALIASDMF